MAKENEMQAVAISTVALDKARAEKERRKSEGVSMSIGAIVSEAVVEKFGSSEKDG